MKTELHPLLIVTTLSKVFATSLTNSLEENGLHAFFHDVSDLLASLASSKFDVLFLEVGGDVDLIHNIIEEIYSKWTDSKNPYIILFVEQKLINDHPQLCAWEINGHATLAALISVDNNLLSQHQMNEIVSYTKRLLSTRKTL